MKQYLNILAVVLFLAAPAHAATKQDNKVGRGEKRCPRWIGVPETGKVYKSSRQGLKCFKRINRATQDGYQDASVDSLHNYSGQWKLEVTLTEDTCGEYDETPTAIPNFLNMTQEGTRVVGVPVPDPNPNGTTYVGNVMGNGFYASNDTPMLDCEDGVGKFAIIYEVYNVVGQEGDATYIVDKTCDSPVPGKSISCRAIFKGHANIFYME